MNLIKRLNFHMSQRIKEFLYIIWLDESTSHSGRIDTIKLLEYYEKK